MVNLDKLTYAGNLGNLQSLADDKRHVFVQGDIGDRELVAGLLQKHQPRAVLHFAAESHVDRSISGPGDFITTNINGTFHLLEDRQDVLVAPATVAELRPLVIVLRLAPYVDHAVDGTRSAQHLFH